MSRLQWTEADTNRAHRLWAVTTFGLEEPEVLPAHLRDASRDPHWLPWTQPRRPGKHTAPTDEEPSPAPVPVHVRREVSARLVLAGVGLVVLAAWLIWRL